MNSQEKGERYKTEQRRGPDVFSMSEEMGAGKLGNLGSHFKKIQEEIKEFLIQILPSSV